MMSSKADSRMGKDEDFNSELLLRDIEEISKALYLPPKAFNSSFDNRPNVTTITSDLESRSNIIIQSSSNKDKKSSIQSSSRKDKKSSIWSWKPLKALTHSRHHRINCCFFLNVHAVEGLPSNFNGLNLCVAWKQKGDVLRTRLAPVCAGMTEFEETLMHQCMIYASRTGAHNVAKYEPKLFLLQTSVIDARARAVDIGKHWVDLTRLLPLTLEELGADKRSSGKWSTSFKLAGRAEGAVLNVSFGFSVLVGNSFDPGYSVKVPDAVRDSGSMRMDDSNDFDNSRANQLHKLGSISTISTQGSYHQSQSKDIKLTDEVIPNRELELGKSINLLYQKLDEGKVQKSLEFDLVHEPLESINWNSGLSSAGGNTMHTCTGIGHNVIEYGAEGSTEDQVSIEQHDSQRFDSSLVEIIDIADIFKEDDAFDADVARISKLDTDGHVQNESVTDDMGSKYHCRIDKEPDVKELDLDSHDMMTSESMDLNLRVDAIKFYEQENCKFSYNSILPQSISLVDSAESIENDFLNMLDIEQRMDNMVSDGGSETSGDCFLRGLDMDNTALENLIIDNGLMEELESHCLVRYGYERMESSDNSDFSFSIRAIERNNHVSPTWMMRTGRNAKMLEYQETESLMQEWGLDEKAFRNSPRASSGGFGSPVYLADEQPLKLPSLGEGLGPIIQTRGGCFLRSMNPLLFQNATNDAKLIIQVSAPIVLPAAMGFAAMEILQHWASGGVQKMAVQANELMPLEDITGKTIQQVISETKSGSGASNRWALQHAEVGLESIGEEKDSETLPFIAQNPDVLYSCTTSEDLESEYVSLENLVPLAIQNIEGLLIEGLKIQSDMQCKESPSSIWIQFSASLETVEDGGDLVKYSVSLEEWIKLDSGGSDGTDEIDENVSKVLAAHGAKHFNFDKGQFVKEDDRFELQGRKGGIFDNNFTMALKVQLRDPLRNYELVGSTMLALIQVERIYSPTQPGLQCLSPKKSCNAEEDGLDENLIQEGIGIRQKQICGEDNPQFKILDIHLAGPNASLANKHLWGTSRHHQSGARWLLSSGIARNNKHLISTSNAIIKPSTTKIRKAWQEDVLWSISPASQREAVPWDELVTLNVHIRNPDIIFPNEASVYRLK